MLKAAPDPLANSESLGGPDALRARVEAAVEQLSRLLLRDAARPTTTTTVTRGAASGNAAALQELVQFLGQALAAWPEHAAEALPESGAGFGSAVEAEDLDTGATDTYTLMAGPLLDIDAGQVSLASPIGQALLGAQPGLVVEIQTPQRLRRLRVMAVHTLDDRVREQLRARSAA